jgi:hypothetical protein
MSLFRHSAFDALEERAVADIQRAEWIDVRAAGRAHFAWHMRVLPHGLPQALALAAINTLVGGSYGDYAVGSLLAENWFYFSGTLVLAYLSARLEWHDREQIHQARYRRRDGARRH